MSNKYISIALMGIMALAACQRAEEDHAPAKVGYTLIVDAAHTKALALDGQALNSFWADGEQVAVYLDGALLGRLSATADASDASQATLAGTLETIAGVTAGTTLTLLYPRDSWDYSGQDGSAPSADGALATKYDYSTAEVTVATVDDVNQTISTTGVASFVNRQSMYRFGFKLGGVGEQIPVKGFTVASAANTLVRSCSWAAGSWTDELGSISVNAASPLTLSYVSLRNNIVGMSSSDTYTFSVIDEDNALYLGQKEIPAQLLDTHGKFISAQSIAVAKAALTTSSTPASEVW